MRELYGKKYLKIFLKRLELISDVKSALTQLPSVAKINITDSTSMYSPPKNLTVYPKVVFSIEEMKNEVEAELELYFSGGTSDPVFIDKPIPALGDPAYFAILDYIFRLGRNLEKYPSMTEPLDEEGLRDYFLPFLNAISKNHVAVGEAFNKKGRTDILIQDGNGYNVFIAECKLWKGKAYLHNAIDQLLERYVNWRDEKAALIVFNKEVLAFSEVINNAIDAVQDHANCVQMIRQRKDSSFSFIFKHSDDPSKKIKFELVLFNFKSH